MADRAQAYIVACCERRRLCGLGLCADQVQIVSGLDIKIGCTQARILPHTLLLVLCMADRRGAPPACVDLRLIAAILAARHAGDRHIMASR